MESFMFFHSLKELPFELKNIVSTFILILIVFLLRSFVIKAFLKWNESTNLENKRKLTVGIKNTFNILFLIGLIFIWGTELRTLAFSVVVIASAIVVAFKEMIMCLMGSFFKTSTKMFEIGDRISVHDLRGEVLDHGLLKTTLFEIGPGQLSHQFTGRIIKFPNSLLLTEAVSIESASNAYALHTFVLPFERSPHWETISQIILEEANRVCEPYLKDAGQFITRLSQKEGIDSPTVNPKINLSLPDSETIDYYLRIPVPFDKKSKIEKEIIEASLRKIDSFNQKLDKN